MNSSSLDAGGKRTYSEELLWEIATTADLSGQTLSRIEKALSDMEDARARQMRQLHDDVKNIRSMTNWIAGIALMFGVAFVVKACG